MAKKTLNEIEQKIINEVKDIEFKAKLTEGSQNGQFMTREEFCQRLEKLKTSLLQKYRMRHGNNY